jgi:hypothetical protein
MVALFLAMVLTASPAKAPTVDVQVVINETAVAQSAGDQAVALLKEKGYQVAPAALAGDPPKKKLKGARRILKLEVLKPSTCYVTATLTAQDTGKTLFTWQTQIDADPCPDQIRKAIEAMAAKAPPAK